jgi:hypothetical protein
MAEELEGAGGGSEGGGGGEPADIGAAIDSTMEETFKEISSRDEEGGESAAKSEGERPAAPAAKAEGEKPGADAPAPTSTSKPAPRSWASEMHEAWGKLDPNVQAYIEKRESQMEAGVAEVRQDAMVGRKLLGVLTPFAQDIHTFAGGDPVRAINVLLHAERALRTGTPEVKLEAFAKLARDYGVDLKAVAEGRAPPPPNPELEGLKQQVSALTSNLTAEQQARFYAVQQATQKQVTDFFTTHPDAEEVVDHIVLLLQDPRNTLESAYEQAIWANPTTRAKSTARLKKEIEDGIRAKAEEEAKKARRGMGTQVRDAAGRFGAVDNSNAPAGSIDETLRNTMREIKTRTSA